MVAGQVAIDGLLAQALLALAAQQGLGVGIKQADDGRYRLANPALAQLLGCPGSDLVGRSDADLFDTTTTTLLRTADHTALAQGSALISDHRFELQGERRDVQVLRLVAPATASGGESRLICSVWQDMAPQRQRDTQLRVALDQLEQQQKANDGLRAELADQGLRDQASGLYSRAHDRICEAMGRLLRGNTRAMDASCRIDDRHFAVLLSGVGLATAHSRMEGLRRQCATQIVMLDGVELSFTVAMGVASFPHTAHSHDELTTACTTALAEARRRGGNTVALASIRFDAV